MEKILYSLIVLAVGIIAYLIGFSNGEQKQKMLCLEEKIKELEDK